MNLSKSARLTIVPPLLLLLILTITFQIHEGHAAGSVIINPTNSPLQGVNGKFQVQVKVTNVDPYNGWDVEVWTDPSVINATSLSIVGSDLTVNATATVIELTNCINGRGNGCNAVAGDGPGVAHSAAAGQGSPPASTAVGLLFTINYTVVGPGGYSPLQFKRVTMSNGSSGQVQVARVDGSYGRQMGPFFGITSSQPSLNVTRGSSVNSTIILVSFQHFKGNVTFSYSISVNGATGITAAFTPARVKLADGGTNETFMTISTSVSTPTPFFVVTIMGSNGTLYRNTFVSVSVIPPPDFLIDARPSLMLIHANSTGTSTIILSSTRFSGRLNLTLYAQNVTAVLNPLNVILTPGSGAIAMLTVTTPSSAVPFNYKINVIASNGTISHSIQITVKPPRYDVATSVTPAIASTRAGNTVTFGVTLNSTDYFAGTVYLFASAVQGKLALSPSSARLSFGETAQSNMTLVTDSSMAPGVYLITLTVVSEYFIPTPTPINHQTTVTLYIVAPPPIRQTQTRTILGLQPVAYFGIIVALGIGLVAVTFREVRKPKQRSGLLSGRQ
jgi:hypothetical protein